MTYGRLWKEGVEMLVSAEVAEPEENAWILFEFVFGIDRAHYFLRREEEAPEEKRLLYRELLARRGAHVPVQYLTGFAWFMGLKFFVDGSVLIPRQDTETLAEEVLKEVSAGKESSLKVLDLCAGSGCIGIGVANCLAKRGVSAALTEADISEAALATARKNGDYHGIACEYVRSDLFSELNGRRYDYILSNPPYIETSAVETLMEEVKNHEPRLALDGGGDGLFFYRRIAKESRAYLEEKGRLFLEIGYDQGEAVKELLTAEGFCDVRVVKDLAGKPRVVKAHI
ncbi:MAG: peptide chain release factor N(5)-glutamine methyltransferase [Lachnospiraceae bacterium]|nr:peptide chain release factor N(5)-glutamine methyltransferase [Lachnospiraceae bacterium]